MGEKVKRNFARFYKLRYSRFNIFDACLTTLIVLLFITLLRPAPVRPESSLDRCGSHYFLFGSPNKAGRWSPPSHRPVEIDQSKTADGNTELFTGEAGGLMGHDITRPPVFLATEGGGQRTKRISNTEQGISNYEWRKTEDWLDRLVEKIWLVESSGRLNPPDGDGGRAVGALQLHKCVVDDVNCYYQANFSYADRGDFPKARSLAKLYIRMWLDAHKTEIAARIFNGGPRGWQKKSTDGYWAKVKNVATEDREF